MIWTHAVLKNFLAYKSLGLTHSEVAERMSTTEGAIKSMLRSHGGVTGLKNELYGVKKTVIVFPYQPRMAPLDALGGDQCRWPFGDKVPYTFCGSRVVTGSYCEHHKEIARRKTRND